MSCHYWTGSRNLREGNGGVERTAGVMKLHIRMSRVNVGVKMGNGSDSPGSLSSSCSITDLLSEK